MLNELFPNDQEGPIARRKAVPEGQQQNEGGALDLRSEDPSSKRDGAAHRRSEWLYEDLLH